jgi:phytoene synthase
MNDESHDRDAAALCADEVRARHFGRYASTLFVSPVQRRGLLALYAFNSEVTGVRDHVSQPLPGEIRLQWWSDALTGAGHGDVQGHPVAAELSKAIETFNLPVDDLVRLIDAHRFDVYDDPMPTMEALESYLADTEAVLFSLAARICASDKPITGEVLKHAGAAQGLAHVIERLPVHSARRQLYLPMELLELNAVAIEDVFAGRATPQLRLVLTYLSQRARRHLNTALDGVAVLPTEQRQAFLPLTSTKKMLQRMEGADFDPFRQPQSSRLGTLWALWRATRKAPFI